MHKQISLLLLIFSSIFWFGFDSVDLIQKSNSAFINPMATPTPDASNDSFSLELDRYTVIYPCPPGFRCVEKGDKDLSVVVTISNTKSDDNSLRYKYKTSGGRVIGEGAKASWDLMGGQPGNYTITVTIEDKAGNELQTATKEITVLANGIGDCFCPEISVDAPIAAIQPGEIMIFTVNVRGGAADNLTYNWTISKGKIIDGQGTPVIRVATDSKMADSKVKATINFGGNAFCGDVCVQTFSAEGFVAAKKRKKK